MDRRGRFLFPQKRAKMSKMLTQDDTVIFGNFDVHLPPLMRKQMAGKGPDEHLFSISGKEYWDQFRAPSPTWELHSHILVTDQAQHGGATRDILLGRLGHTDVRKREDSGAHTARSAAATRTAKNKRKQADPWPRPRYD